MNKTKKEIAEDIEVIKPKKQHNFKDLIEAPFENMDYVKNQDKLLIRYREQEIQLLKQILSELQKLTSSKEAKNEP